MHTNNEPNHNEPHSLNAQVATDNLLLKLNIHVYTGPESRRHDWRENSYSVDSDFTPSPTIPHSKLLTCMDGSGVKQ